MVEIKTSEEKTIVRVRAHKRRMILKVTASEDYFHVRLLDPARLRSQGYRFRTTSPDKARDLSESERRAIKDADGKVIIAVRERRRITGYRTQAIILPREK